LRNALFFMTGGLLHRSVNRPLDIGVCWVHGDKSIEAWLLLSFLLFRTRYVRYFIVIWYMCFMSFFILFERVF
jgi:hypothetical protein